MIVPMADITERIERAWLIGCSRCANEGQSYSATLREAGNDFLAWGWTQESFRTFCPQCNGDLRARS